MANVSTSLAEGINPDRFAQLEKMIETAKHRLVLSDEQLEQIRPILKSNFEKRQQILKENGVDINSIKIEGSYERPSFQELRAIKKDLTVIRKETSTALSKVLMDQQMNEYYKIEEERREKVRDRIRSRR